jgi:hypothetical protein
MNASTNTAPTNDRKRFLRKMAAPSSLLVALALLWPAETRAADIGKNFSTPQEAIGALANAANAKDREALRALFGLATDELVAADQVQATNELDQFVAAFNQTNRVVPASATKCVLEVGANRWPFPIPLVKKNGRWSFDTEAGKEELINRRIGKNELEALQTVRACVDAQREYAARDRDGDEVLEYAQRLISTTDSKDGLYWPPELDGEISPLGPLVAEAQVQGYDVRSREGNPEPRPFHGYYFKILMRQGKHAAGGKYDYIINGNMIGGFALVAWPAHYGESGIMTFLVNQQGKVYQKDLGPKTSKLAAAMKAYDPDAGWAVSPD